VLGPQTRRDRVVVWERHRGEHRDQFLRVNALFGKLVEIGRIEFLQVIRSKGIERNQDQDAVRRRNVGGPGCRGG